MNALDRTLAALRRADDPRPMLYDPAADSPQERLAEHVEYVNQYDDELAKAIVARCTPKLADEIVRLARAWRAGADLDEAAQGICDELDPVVETYAVDVLRREERTASLPEIRAAATEACEAYALMVLAAPGLGTAPYVVCVEDCYTDSEPTWRKRRVVLGDLTNAARGFLTGYLADRRVYVTVCGEDRL